MNNIKMHGIFIFIGSIIAVTGYKMIRSSDPRPLEPWKYGHGKQYFASDHSILLPDEALGDLFFSSIKTAAPAPLESGSLTTCSSVDPPAETITKHMDLSPIPMNAFNTMQWYDFLSPLFVVLLNTILLYMHKLKRAENNTR